jgi:lipoprotein-anchoring transpeptidase ErfK/SrfK
MVFGISLHRTYPMIARDTALAVVLGLAMIGGATAQQNLPGRYAPGAYPAAPVSDDDDDIVEGAPEVMTQPLPAPGGRGVPYPAGPQQPPYERQAMPGVYQPGPPVYGPEPAVVPGAPNLRPADDSRQALRPPGDIDTTGTLPNAPPAASSNAAPGNPVALLPPEDQPEEGQPKELPPHLRRQMVDYWTKEPAGTIIIDTPNTYLYLVTGEGKAMRYGIGVGREGFTWTGRERISKMAEWPDWNPPKEMIDRQPYLPRFMAGGDSNPLGARALYLGNTLYRIHGTNQPSTIGSFVSSGCIRLTNNDIEDLYQRVKVGSRVVVLPGNPAVPPSAANQATQTR